MTNMIVMLPMIPHSPAALKLPAPPAWPHVRATPPLAPQRHPSPKARFAAEDLIYAVTMLSCLIGAVAGVLWAARIW